jgi:mRNA interferase RelE/StbE
MIEGGMMKNIVDEVRYSRSAQKFIKTRDAKEKLRIKNIIEDNLKHLPATGDIKPLEEYSDGIKRLRIGSIRIIFRYDNNNKLLILNILDIGNRGDVYK